MNKFMKWEVDPNNWLHQVGQFANPEKIDHAINQCNQVLEIEDLIHEIKMPVLNVLMKYKKLQTMLDLKLDKSDFENHFENAQQIDEVYNKIKISENVEEKK